jgi:hypothetical protein
MDTRVALVLVLVLVLAVTVAKKVVREAVMVDKGEKYTDYSLQSGTHKHVILGFSKQSSSTTEFASLQLGGTI